MTDRALLKQALDALIENARLLGITQAKRGYGFYSQEDAIFERAFHECIAKHSAVLLERLAQPERERMSKMTDRELLEQAHDALYKEDRISGYANYGKLRKALRERLAQPDPRNQCGETCERAKLCAVCLAQMEKDPIQLFTDVQQEIETVLAQPEQKPVAAQHRFRHPEKTMPDWSKWQECKVSNRPAWEIDSQGYEVEYRNLYTPPLEQERREWQGLTNEEISAISKSIPGETDLLAGKRLFARAIEAKLKEKNT
jgi:hypothetical protein